MAAHELVWSPEAETDFLSIWDRGASVSAHVADAHLRDIHLAVTNLIAFPYAGAARDEIAPGIRSVVVSPTVVFYRVGSISIDIVRVVDGRRNLAGFVSPRRGHVRARLSSAMMVNHPQTETSNLLPRSAMFFYMFTKAAAKKRSFVRFHHSQHDAACRTSLLGGCNGDEATVFGAYRFGIAGPSSAGAAADRRQRATRNRREAALLRRARNHLKTLNSWTEVASPGVPFASLGFLSFRWGWASFPWSVSFFPPA